MVNPGKNFRGQRGFPTPNSTPEDTVRRIFVVPNSVEWLGLLEGAVQALLEEWRFYQWGELTPGETVEAFNAVILASYANRCQCTLPGGEPVIRLNPDTGHVEELGEDGEWGAPTGDYALPAIPPRETDAICLAAANCANALQLLYESLSDSFASELSDAAAYIAMADFLVTVTSAAVGLITLGIGLFVLAAFAAVYAAVEIITADLWDANFTKALTCILVNCSTDDGGVVTFDYQCFQDALYSQLNTFDLTADQLRLYGQVMFIVNSIGGADGLDQMGGTTAITEYDCGDCASSWCYSVDLTASDGGFALWGAGQGAYSAGVGWIAADVFLGGSLRTILQGGFPFSETLALTSIGFIYDWHSGTVQAGVAGVAEAINGFGEAVFSTDMAGVTDGDDLESVVDVALPTVDSLEIDLQCSHGAYGGSATLKSVTLNGTGAAPTFLEAMGWVAC